MGDIIDKANETADIYLASSLSWKRAEGPEAIGLCLNCDTELHTATRWCDADCRDDWVKRNGVREILPEQQRLGVAEGTYIGPHEPEPPKDAADLEAQNSRAGVFE